MHHVVHFDIETIPSQLPWVREYITETIKPPATIKKAESIQKWHDESKPEAIEEALNKAGFSGASNHIITIAWAVDDGVIDSYQVGPNLDDEKEILSRWFRKISELPMGTTFAGHNILGFDIRVIKQRAMVLGIKIPRNFPIDAKPWGTEVYDTMLKWDGRDFVKADLIARAFGIQGKKSVDGSMVYPMWKDGKYAEIAEYCRDDVEMSRAIYNRMTFKS
jgi:predicted PolB exonuclease-like 3'-5' exonuclease